jgi:hypothetical protein
VNTVKATELRVAARVADALVYATGVAGVVAGGLLFRSGQLAFAVVAWVLTFVAGAVLRLVAWGVRALADLLERSERMERTLDDLARDRLAADRRDPGAAPDPSRRWGGHG